MSTNDAYIYELVASSEAIPVLSGLVLAASRPVILSLDFFYLFNYLAYLSNVSTLFVKTIYTYPIQWLDIFICILFKIRTACGFFIV